MRILDKDLREPTKNTLSATESDLHSVRLLKSISIFIGSYSILHKLIIPAALKFTALQLLSYAKVDFWFVPVLFFLAYLILDIEWGYLGSLLLGALTAQGFLATYKVLFVKEELGWLVFSHLLSSAPLSLVSMLLSFSYRKHRCVAISGFFLTLGIFIFIEAQTVAVSVVDTKMASKQTIKNNSITYSGPNGCGLQSFQFSERDVSQEPIIALRECGLIPSAVSLKDKDFLLLENNTEKALNFHFYVHGKTGFVKGWNVLVAANDQIKSPPLKMGGDEVGVLFSDANPAVGLSVITTPKSFIEHKDWHATRTPLRVESEP